MADLTYNTTDPNYQQFLNGLPLLIAYMKPILAKFRKVWANNRSEAKAWAKRDPLLMAFLEFLVDVEKKAYIRTILGEDLDKW